MDKIISQVILFHGEKNQRTLSEHFVLCQSQTRRKLIPLLFIKNYILMYVPIKVHQLITIEQPREVL